MKVKRPTKKKSKNLAKKKSLPLTAAARGTVEQMASLSSLAAVITLPAERSPLRFPTQQLGANQTATFDLTKFIPVDYSAVTAPSQVFMLCSSPVSPVWGTIARAARGDSNWSSDVPLGTSGVMLYTYNYFEDNNPIPCYPMRVEGLLYHYVPKGVTWSFGGGGHGGGGGAGTCEVTVRTLTRQGEFRQYIVTLAVAAGIWSKVEAAPAEGMWVSLVSIETALPSNNNVTAYVHTDAGTGFWPLMQCPSLGPLAPMLESMRVNSSALLLTNTTAQLYRNGDVVGGRVMGRDVNVFDPAATKARIEGVNTKLRYSGAAEKGCYTFLTPSTASLNWSDYRGNWPANTNVAVPVVYDPADFEYVNVVHFNCSVAGGGFTIKARHDMHLEVITDAEIYDLGVPQISYDEFAAVVTAASSIVPFTENPTHMAALGHLGRTVLTHLAPYLVPMGRMAVSKLAGTANRFLDRWT